ncbi:uncharacterized protein THITE_2122267 [Thermothielavioides terrestris NRRL 8126]|uniref:Uncharacterized protein n=1 Tax=Thermothielavioides terrestris (strain ATCC 38088 / NRRL 8126) TaxID=578455 RepID=G2RCN3_THETT|nr:uncharacterized protein THITE_2122267 [Thermothielavioides terrestris NRRL 8126]AEO70629.1 hypothetical protein THITE_2122267 [Thermothielavioides terrestris NRRL 8126]
MASASAANAVTTLRTAADEAADTASAGRNWAAEKFREWPNEAGFEGLTEHRGPIELTVQGHIPVWAAGILYRTGPGVRTVDDTKSGAFHIDHWFDGLAHTHRFEIFTDKTTGDGTRDGVSEATQVRVRYSSRFQSDAIVKDIKAAGRFPAISFGQRSDPCLGLFSKFMSNFHHRNKRLDNYPVTVQAGVPLQRLAKARETAVPNRSQGHRASPGPVFLGTDTAWLSEIDPETMEPRGPLHPKRLHPDLKGAVGPAHAMVDPETNDYFGVNIDVALSATYRIFQVSAATGETTILATIKEKPAYIHSFFLTRNYVVLCIPVSQFDGLRASWEGSLLGGLKPFDETEPCKWFVVDRRRRGRGGLVGVFRSPAAFFFHSVNAFEDDNGDLLCDLVKYPSTDIIRAMYYRILLNHGDSAKEFWTDPKTAGKRQQLHLARYRLRSAEFQAQEGHSPTWSSVPAAELEFEIAGPHAGDMPTINPAYACRKHRYVYCLINRGLSTLFDSIAKVDTHTRQVVSWSGGVGHSPGEAIFIARPGVGEDGQRVESEEDDGVLLSVVLDGFQRSSYLVCLDAKTMTELGRAECGFAVAFGFHGQHIRGKEEK